MDLKVCADLSWLLVFIDGLKKSSSFNKSAILMAKMVKKCQKLVIHFFWTLKPPFLYTNCRPYMGLHSCQLPDPIRPKMSKHMVKKCKKNHFLNPFLGHFLKSETGSESISRSIMASSSQKLP